MAEKAIRLGGESTADAIVSAVDSLYPEHTFEDKEFALKHNDDEIAVDTNFAAQSFWKDAILRFFGKRSAVLGLILIVVIELLDRFGDPPKAVSALLDVALLRSDAAFVGICDISQKERQLIFRFTDRVDPPSLLAVCAMASYKGRLLLHSGTQPYLTLYLKEKETSLEAASALVERLRIKREEKATVKAARLQ